MTDLHPDARRVVDLARQEATPDAAHKARLERRIALSVGLAVVGSGAVASNAVASSAVASGTSALKGASAASHAVVLKLGLTSSIIVTAIAGYALLGRTPPQSTPVEPRVAAQQPPQEVHAPPAPPEPEAMASSAPSAPEPSARPKARPKPPRKAESTPADALSDELSLLHRAQAAWRGRDATAALERVREHRARYPGSALALERDALQVLALCELGRATEARALAKSWLASAERSPLRRSIEQSCALR